MPEKGTDWDSIHNNDNIDMYSWALMELWSCTKQPYICMQPKEQNLETQSAAWNKRGLYTSLYSQQDVWICLMSSAACFLLPVTCTASSSYRWSTQLDVSWREAAE